MTKSFSERIGINVKPRLIQVEQMDDELKNSIWNFLHNLFSEDELWHSYAVRVAQDFRKSRLDEVPTYNVRCMEWMKNYFFALPWNRIYELLEYTVANVESFFPNGVIQKATVEIYANVVLKTELSGYRFISGVLLPISNTQEMDEISNAVQTTQRIGLDGAYQHLQSAINLLGQKPDPDYRNSVKESILSIESIARVIAEEKSTGLRDALAKLSNILGIHGSLKEGFLKLYGYTSDQGGIRHSFTEQDQEVGMDEAKYMLVSCSAFANYLISKAQKANLL